ncbi:DnaJ (Hsp40), subfamily C, member 17 [Balamuthia mandrillaris]
MEIDSLKEDAYYEILGLTIQASKEDISKAFRALALKYHPDKNRGDPKAADRFHKIRKANDVLSDDQARAAYDNVVRAQQLRKQKAKEMGTKRRQMTESLLERERAFKKQKSEEEQAKRRLEAEMERLRREGYLKMKRERERLYEMQKEQRASGEGQQSKEEEAATLKVRWRRKGTPLYDKERLTGLFQPFGPLKYVALSKKGGSALVTFASVQDAVTALVTGGTPTDRGGRQMGDPSNPLRIALATASSSDSTAAASRTARSNLGSDGERKAAAPIPTSSTGDYHEQLERQTLLKMAQVAAFMRRRAGLLPNDDEEEEKEV